MLWRTNGIYPILRHFNIKNEYIWQDCNFDNNTPISDFVMYVYHETQYSDKFRHNILKYI